MRGQRDDQDQLSSYAGLEEYVPTTHPLRHVRTVVDSMLKETDTEFENLYSDVGRPSILPEQLLRWWKAAHRIDGVADDPVCEPLSDGDEEGAVDARKSDWARLLADRLVSVVY